MLTDLASSPVKIRDADGEREGGMVRTTYYRFELWKLKEVVVQNNRITDKQLENKQTQSIPTDNKIQRY